MRRFTRSIAIVALVALGGWQWSGPIAAATPTDPPAATFSFPGTRLSLATTDGWSVRWDLSGASVASQRLIDRIGTTDANGGCKRAALKQQVVHEAVASPFDLGGDAGHCHRFRLELLDANGAVVATAISGMLLVLTSWTGGRDLYRPGIFATQRTFTWCVGASVQMMVNMIRGRNDHTAAGQRMYMTYARLHDRATGLRGTNPLGWQAALNHYAGGARYRVRASLTLRGAIQNAARRLRITGHPVGLLVARGSHAWVMSGFTATADPAKTRHFTVTAIFVEGPLYPIGHRHGFDKPPDTAFTLAALRRYMKPYDASDRSWRNRFLTVHP